MLSYSGESVQQAHQRPYAGPHRHICRGSQSGLRKAVCALQRRVFSRRPASSAGRQRHPAAQVQRHRDTQQRRDEPQRSLAVLRSRGLGPVVNPDRHAADATIGPSIPPNPQSVAHHRRPRRFRHHRRRSHYRSPPISTDPVGVIWPLMMTKLGSQDTREIVCVGELWKRVTSETV